MNLKDFLEDCKQENIIDQTTVDRMYSHFLAQSEKRSINAQNQSQLNQNKKNDGLIITVSIIGIFLIGFGIIYLFAHNWDNLSRPTKTILSLLPVFLSVLANIFTVTKRKDSVIWQESTAISSFLAVGSMLGLILQIYQLPGIENYFFTYWCILCLPIVYLLRSHSAVFCAMALMFMNLFSYPMDQSAIYQIPWFGSLIMFLALVPYLKRLFTLRQPESLYVTHQIVVPLLICFSAIISMSGSDSSIWLILFLLLANFHLFGTSRFLRNSDHQPNAMSILSYIGVSLSLTYLLFYNKWGFANILQLKTPDYRLIFIPILFALGLVQLFRYFSKEKMTPQNLYKWILLLPVPFIAMDYFGLNAFPYYQLTILISTAIVVHFAQNRKDPWQIYPALGIIAVLVFSLSYINGGIMAFFLFSLIPSMYYLVPASLLDEKSKNTLSSDQIIVLSFQILFLIIASFGGFWALFNYTPLVLADYKYVPPSMSSFQVALTGLICIGLVLNVIKLRKQLFSHLKGLFALFSLIVPVMIWIGCISTTGLQHMYSVFLLLLGIIVLVYSAKKSNLTIANFALGLIGLVMLCRFFDLKMSLTVKGILFILIGSSFFVANYLILKNRKHENSK
ncbi:DUF2157 domain-containing protein [Fluviicola taffensis]|uniref:DUF2157 domain-containing protein n=1 Tax=Fluviicola taffensis TaxID=191579 RepID=UPI0031378263